jgi:GDPmannose 4,6-dehydratase
MNCLITGVRGQDGILMAQLLIKKGHFVVGLHTRQSQVFEPNLSAFISLQSSSSFIAFATDYTLSELRNLLKQYEPKCVFHFAAVSSTASISDDWETLIESNVSLTQRILSACSELRYRPKVFFASSSEAISADSQNSSRYRYTGSLRTSYGISKRMAGSICDFYRNKDEIDVKVGYLFNHESCFRQPWFVTRKISLAVVLIAHGIISSLTLGDLSTTKDWGDAKQFSYFIYDLMFSDAAENIDQIEIGTGQPTSLEQLVRLAFAVVELDFRDFVSIDRSLFRQSDLKVPLLADTTKLCSFAIGQQLRQRTGIFIRQMVESDLLTFNRDGKDNVILAAKIAKLL